MISSLFLEDEIVSDFRDSAETGNQDADLRHLPHKNPWEEWIKWNVTKEFRVCNKVTGCSEWRESGNIEFLFIIKLQRTEFIVRESF